MSACVEVIAWGRQPREGEQAYAAFLAYRDLGPWRTHEATRLRLGKRPGYLKPIERWSARRDWRLRAGAWDAHLQAERDEVTAQETAKWERRRLQAMEDGWQTCRALRARLAQRLDSPPEMQMPTPAVAPAMPAMEAPGALADADAGAPPEEAKATAGRGPAPVRCDDLTLARLAKLIVDLEWALIAEALPAPPEIDPLTATDDEIKAYLARHPRLGRPPRR